MDKSSTKTDANGMVYCNLDDECVLAAIDQQLAYFAQRLAELGIAVPNSMFTNVEADRLKKVGNRQVR